MLKSFLLVSILLISSLLQAQSPNVAGASKNIIVYRSPENGDSYVPSRTTIIIRLGQTAMRSRTAQDFSFDVTGRSSGVHKGEVLIAGDNTTIIFKPDRPFVLDEIVDVLYSISGEKSISPVRYSFQITPTSDARQYYLLNLLRKKEQKEMEEFQKEIEVKNQHRVQNSILDSLPPNFPKITIDFVNSAKVAPGNIFIAPNNNLGGTSDFLIISDNAGIPVFERDMSPSGILNKLPVSVEDFKIQSNNRLSFFKLDTVLHGEIFLGDVFLMNSHFGIIDSFQCGNGYHADGHDFQLLPNGHSLLVAYDPMDSVDMKAITGNPNASSHATVFGAIIQELDTQKNVVFQWRSWDHFSITDATHENLTAPFIDYAHINSVEMDTDSTIIASFRHMDEVTKINPKNGKIIWRWGGKKENNYFAFTGDTLPFSQQHDVRRIPNGHITMWDNGDYRKTVWGDGSYHDTAYSRAVEYELNESGPLTATAVWEYTDLPFSSAAGNVQRLANGNTFIGFGYLNAPNAIEVTSTGEKVFQLSLPQGTFNYRSFRYEFPEHSSVIHPPGTGSDFGIQSIYPNPAASKINVVFFSSDIGTSRIELLNVLGQTVRSSEKMVSAPGTCTIRLDLQELPPGMYYCKLQQNEHTSGRAIVVQR